MDLKHKYIFLILFIFNSLEVKACWRWFCPKKTDINDVIYKVYRIRSTIKDYAPIGADYICPMCLVELNNSKIRSCTACENKFHADCLESWLDISPTCPSCQTNMS